MIALAAYRTAGRPAAAGAAMDIAAGSESTGLSKDTLRWYEKRGSSPSSSAPRVAEPGVDLRGLALGHGDVLVGEDHP